MPETSKELLNDPQKSSILESLLLGRKDQTPPSKLGKHQTYVNLTEKPSITPIPKSQVLGKVRDFLGIMAKANDNLEIMARENPCSNYDIEVLNGNEEEYIEMDLLLGVADLHSNQAVSAAEAAIAGLQPAVVCTTNRSSSATEGSDIDDSEDDTSTDSNRNKFKEATKPVSKPNKRRKVVMLD